MKFLANENIPAPVITMLRAQRVDILSIAEESPGVADSVVVERALSDGRILVTSDKDFGELAFRWRAIPPGIVLFRLAGSVPEEDNRRMVAVLLERSDWLGHFSVVESDRVRMRPMPETPADGD
ncbi:MAG: DUF5615 family PIN-like protein [Phycisphaerales bacterium]|nr:DUF5615 family PIN-like protein [Phycisphaerales bacterium]